MTADIATLPPRDPFFALAPELRLHLSEIDGALVVNSREVARVFFHRKHRRVLRKILRDIWREPMRPERWHRNGSIDMTSEGLVIALSHWGFGKRKRVNEFVHGWVQLVCAAAKEIRAKTGSSPIAAALTRAFPGMSWRIFTEDGLMCCEDCRVPPRVWGPILRDELWATIAHEDVSLCFDCVEYRLGRSLTRDDLVTCPWNAGWVPFDETDMVAARRARVRRLLSEHP